MGIVISIAIIILVSGLILIGCNILYDLAAAIIPIVALVMIIIGVIVGFAVAIKNTISVYYNVFSKKGK